MIKFDYLNHDFVQYVSINKNLQDYRYCKKCLIRVYLGIGSNEGEMYYFTDKWYILNLTCEEFIIKSILE